LGRYILHHKGWFFEWSTVVDAPVTQAMTEPEFRSYFLRLHGDHLEAELDERLARAKATGCSAAEGFSLADIVSHNRAGPGEACLSVEEVLALVMTPDDGSIH
jgi:hypothetical protein